MKDVRVNDSASNAPEEIQRLAKKITDRHDCPGVLAREVSGYHLYIPCPECLKTHGRRELDDPKYSINLSMIAGLGDEFRVSAPAWMPEGIHDGHNLEKRKEWGSSICMRTRSSREPHRFGMDELMNMATVTDRHPDILTKAALHGGTGSAEKQEFWEVDPISGKEGPPPPGEVVKLSDLPATHPAVVYLTNRGYNVNDLEEQFRCCFCTKEFPYGEKGIYYRRMPGFWKDTPQNRVIFYSIVDGAPLTWQARLIEKVTEDELNQYMLHPYAGGFYPGDDMARIMRSLREHPLDVDYEFTWDEQREGYWVSGWSHTGTRSNPKAKWVPVSPFDELKDGQLRFKPSKYRTAKYSSRQMMGWDAALRRAEEAMEDNPWVVLCEGPLDAARVGPGGVALIGSSISPDNAAKVASKFKLVLTGFDADKAGREATEKITRQLFDAKLRAPLIANVIALPIPQGKDIGDLRPDEYERIFKKILKRSQRTM